MRTIIAILVSSCLATGCGTLVTATSDDCGSLQPYSGTRAGLGPHTLLDVPFSFVADTVLLPITVPKAIIEHASGGPNCRTEPTKAK